MEKICNNFYMIYTNCFFYLGPDHVHDQSHVQRITKVDLDHDPDLDLDPDLAQNRHLKKLIVKPLDQDLAQSQKKMKKLMMQKPMMMVIMTKMVLILLNPKMRMK